jgi:hypothetical protein
MRAGAVAIFAALVAVLVAAPIPVCASDARTDASSPISSRIGERVQLALGADLGFADYGRTDGDGDVGFGPAWHLRVGLQLAA